MLLTSCGKDNATEDGHTVCADADNNHKCDVCADSFSTCADGNLDHNCDVCGTSLSECKDEDSDHKCDACQRTVSVCSEGDGHTCSTCGAVTGVCTDADFDHLCDKCDATFSTCTDTAPKDHACDICKDTLSECADSDSDHGCDECGKAVSICTDGNNNHVCDLCRKTLSTCLDEGGDHYCDVCATKLSDCSDTDSDHKCNICSRTLSVCTDTDANHECDLCRLRLSECKDGDANHECDLCQKRITECAYENRVCTVCGKTNVYGHVIIIGVDGAGAFFDDTPTPNMDAIFSDGAITYNGITESPSLSAQAWASLLHGVSSDVHGITAGSVGAYPMSSHYPSFFRVIRENDHDAKLGSFATWDTVNKIMIEDADITKVGGCGTDADLTDRICAYVESTSPDVLFVQFDNVDATGHAFGFGSDEHLAKITETDVLIGRIYDSYVKAGIIDDTLFIVTTDHGGTKVTSGDYLGNHGGETPEEKLITFAAKGKTVIDGGNIDGFEIRDTAAIVLYALGYEQPASWTARVPSGLFEGVTAGERPDGTNPQGYSLTT